MTRTLTDETLTVTFRGDRPRIVCLCGSTRFVHLFNEARRTFARQGMIVLGIDITTPQTPADDPQHADPGLKARLDELHRRQIDLADFVYVINPGNYVGESTRAEIDYADANGVLVLYMQDPAGIGDPE